MSPSYDERYADVDHIPQSYHGVSITCSYCDSGFQIGNLQSRFVCPNCESGLEVHIIEGYALVSYAEGSGSVKVSRMPELPRQRLERLTAEYDLSKDTAEKITSTRERADFYEELADTENGEAIGSLLTNEIFGELNYRDMDITDVEPQQFDHLVQLVSDGSITDKQITDIIRKSLDEGISTKEVFNTYEYEVIEHTDLEDVVASVIEDEPDAVQDYKSGNEEAVNYLMGQVMSSLEGGANPQDVREMLANRLNDQ